MRSAGTPSFRQMSYASSSRGMPFSPLKIETTIRSGSHLPDVGQQFPGEGQRVFLEVVAEREVAEHLEERVVAMRRPDVVEVVVLAADPHDLLRRRGARVARAFRGRGTVSLNWFIPALVNSSVGSSPGTSGELGTTRWPRLSKNLRKDERISLEVIARSIITAVGATFSTAVASLTACVLQFLEQRQHAVAVRSPGRRGSGTAG